MWLHVLVVFTDNFSINGYERETNPGLSKFRNLYSFKNMTSQANMTIYSLQLSLTEANPRNFKMSNNGNSFITAYKESGYKVF